MHWIVGVDVGGTFTDFYTININLGDVAVHKRPSTPQDPSEAVIKGLNELLKTNLISPDEVIFFAHGTTIATNTLIQRKGGNVAMLTSQGFRDLLEIGRQIRPSMYDLKKDQPKPLINREQRFEIYERIDFEGRVIRNLNQKGLSRAVENIKNQDIDAVAICFLFSFVNSEHEDRMAKVLRERLPKLSVSVSSEVQPEFREYERFSTTVLNAYLQPSVGRYLERLRKEINQMMPRVQVGINQSNGGLMSIDQAVRFPVRTALSGPAAGVVGATYQGKLSNFSNLITLDMGGTSTDVCLIRNSLADMTNEREVAGFPVRLPAIDIHTIGAGGGSIAWFDRDGLLKVGPISAGSMPGPACYDKGGVKATVSDANLVLGRLPESLVGGEMILKRELAEKAVKPLAEEMGVSIEQAADGIIRVVNSNMVRALQAVSVERGYDPRNFIMMPFGGAGGLHSSAVARIMGIAQILIPLSPGILCAQGLISTELKEIFVKTYRKSIDHSWVNGPKDILCELLDKANRWFREGEIAPDCQKTLVQIEMRYVGQNFELSIDVPEIVGDKITFPDKRFLLTRFHEEHERNYGHCDPTMEVEMVNLRVTAKGKLYEPVVKYTEETNNSSAAKPKYSRNVWFLTDRPIDTPIYDRNELVPGHTISGPAIIEQLDSTTVLFPDDSAQVDNALNINIILPK